MQAFAPAKVNLFLHVGAPAADGYHPVCSLMMFADIGDTVSIRPDGNLRFELDGPFSASLSAETDNLVTRARDGVLTASGSRAKPDLILHKALPIASGLAGGSSDAAATLRLVRDAWDLNLDDAALADIGRRLGSDVPACLAARPVVGIGRGDQLHAPPPLPTLDVVLVNPGMPSPTSRVYKAYDQAVSSEGANEPMWPPELLTARNVAVFLAACRNDLQRPAVMLEPAIGAVLQALVGQPETLLARMSGSGATCFALCSDHARASALAARLRREHRSWWVTACRLRGTGSP